MATKAEMQAELAGLEARKKAIITDEWVSGVGSNGRSVQYGDRAKQIDLIDRRIQELKLALGQFRRGYLVGRR
ncbi:MULTISPECIES: hypothetical protein [Thalassospira]|uniref:Uncharacterized protein n=1 Tax=Thalassospira profundimaris TaxID=502049 RepID=A0A367V7D2_9PROT|nr:MULTISPECIES: hypothetical protein [Thalassospira]KZB73258.1 hypothetical protein AUQ43_18450 [Thalassospira sp. MCCC 1A01148]RCK21095.1 hypothetical protein TH6_15145 [Thalassospira profundimaris]